MRTAGACLPACVLDGHVWPRAHQLRLRDSLDLILKSGCSFFEDLPDMYYDEDLIHSCDTHEQLRGWSQRVTEFVQNLRTVALTAPRTASPPPPGR